MRTPIFVILALLLISCQGAGGDSPGTGLDAYPNEDDYGRTEIEKLLGESGTVPLWCRHESHLICLVLAANGFEVEQVYGGFPEDHPNHGRKHIQCRAKIDGEWMWLHTRSRIYIVRAERDEHLGEKVFSPDQTHAYFMSTWWKGIKRVVD